LAEGRISLSVAGRLAPHLGEDNADQLLAECAGMTKREVEVYLVKLDPQPIFDSSVRKLPDARTADEPGRAPAPGDGGAPAPPPPPPPAQARPGVISPATPEKFNFRFAGSAGLKAKLDRLAEVLGVHNPEKNLAQLPRVLTAATSD
jgi:hypothetical protein